MHPYEDKITVAVAQQLFRSWPTSGSGVVVAVMIALVFRDSVPSWFLLAWVTAFTVHSAVLGALWLRQRHKPFDAAQGRHVIAQNLLGMTVAGILWGGGSAYLLSHGTSSEQFLMLVSLLALSIVILFSNSYHFPTFMVFFGLSILPSIPALLLQSIPGNRPLAALMAAFILMMCALGWNLNRMVRQSLALRFENLALVEQLTQQKGIAEEASVAKSRFLAAASHDLRQPMHAFGLYLGALGALNLPAQARVLSGKLYQCMHSMEDLFRALLDVSQLDAGAVHPRLDVFAIATVLERLRVEFEPQAQDKGLDLRVAPCSAWVRGDSALTERILRNLLSNAVRYTERGRILVGCRRGPQRLRLAVYDTGVGIALADQRRVFEEFLQLGNPQRDRSRGLGLGLSIVERLARLLALPLRLRSTPGRGSVFSVELPLAEPAARSIVPAQSAREADHSLAGRTVVVVDDEQPILDATRSLLEAWGCTVVTAASGAEALACMSREPRPPDLLICDYRLGEGMNGEQVVQALRDEFNQEFPAILVTGDTAPQRLQELEASGLPVLHKPLEAQTLRQALLRALSS
jgi:two-component system, sensor histidine kinase